MDAMTPDSFTDLKRQARKQSLDARKAATREARASAATRLWAQLRETRGVVIAGYMPKGSEVSPLTAMRALWRDNTICVPVVTAEGAPLRFREWWPGCPTEEGAFGVEIPTEGGWRVPDILIVPLVAFDAGCNRLGYGGGFYDRTLAGLANARTIGLAVEAQRLVQVPREANDRALDYVVTESGVHRRPGTE
ncbi:5-formyltetrahydrofolate cyclo-ligase [Jannaschia aquimarina]|uniref:5-formyltetrahydrofolate cyclo-ligase n=1 Tax=Jannaschia aquimarina TaxID=935700 RepID=A0A0D1EEQ1_9RHOB|nr:5-formyltetrahydrofolate cyclo-ligase [Jannaschia aquimarina]KIT16169.1 5-formyltetrahydrofolate cyclo-ligase family protein [Jannaschia aquimarina]SNT36809.1 5-formyltetrahydrofolate cyclo-ligase [Jannaschia aquimarina]